MDRSPGIEKFLGNLTEQMAEADGRPVPEPGDCPTCGKKPPLVFRDELSRKEHEITGCCQACQDELFGPDGAGIPNSQTA